MSDTQATNQAFFLRLHEEGLFEPLQIGVLDARTRPAGVLADDVFDRILGVFSDFPQLLHGSEPLHLAGVENFLFRGKPFIRRSAAEGMSQAVASSG